ncbi:hypothetical protein SKAU_G00387540 [Synaphobranchus kaupii]|uniref:Gypsy retrotransposon integrase-like protein 1 n=1 Tax=Synaphobranchus kaupii TaxID=118154 RepID=A0A9Q1EAT7_SYNKA|nr:hypothetical protein SKAU_G00387540 [Synaphobranchus kaupii]
MTENGKSLKRHLPQKRYLPFFDPRRTKISTDASKDGLGAVLLQADGDNWKPVAYVSRSMAETERRYAQIQKESLGLVFGCEKFHGYVYGLPTFTAETDHKPLISIIRKNLNDMSPRIQRMMMKLQRYDLDLVYTPGKYIVLADALSRAPTPVTTTLVSSMSEDVDVHVNLIASSLPVSEMMHMQIAHETKKDVELQTVMANLQHGWTKGKYSKYYPIRSELSVVNGLLLRRNRIIIPVSMRQEMLSWIHEGHLGIDKCKRRAREAVYWPRINVDIEELISKCDTCLRHRSTKASIFTMTMERQLLSGSEE